MLKIFEISKRYPPLDFGKGAQRGVSFKVIPDVEC